MDPVFITSDVTVGNCLLDQHDNFICSTALAPGCSSPWIQDVYSRLKQLHVDKLLQGGSREAEMEWNKLQLGDDMGVLSDALFSWLKPALAAEMECVQVYLDSVTKRTARSTVEILLQPIRLYKLAKWSMLKGLIEKDLLADMDPKDLLTSAISQGNHVAVKLLLQMGKGLKPRVSDVTRSYADGNHIILAELLKMLFPKTELVEIANLSYSITWLPWENLQDYQDTLLALSDGHLELFREIVEHTLEFKLLERRHIRDCLVDCCLKWDSARTAQNLQMLRGFKVFPYDIALSGCTLRRASIYRCISFLRSLTDANLAACDVLDLLKVSIQCGDVLTSEFFADLAAKRGIRPRYLNVDATHVSLETLKMAMAGGWMDSTTASALHRCIVQVLSSTPISSSLDRLKLLRGALPVDEVHSLQTLLDVIELKVRAGDVQDLEYLLDTYKVPLRDLKPMTWFCSSHTGIVAFLVNRGLVFNAGEECNFDFAACYALPMLFINNALSVTSARRIEERAIAAIDGRCALNTAHVVAIFLTFIDLRHATQTT